MVLCVHRWQQGNDIWMLWAKYLYRALVTGNKRYNTGHACMHARRHKSYAVFTVRRSLYIKRVEVCVYTQSRPRVRMRVQFILRVYGYAIVCVTRSNRPVFPYLTVQSHPCIGLMDRRDCKFMLFSLHSVVYVHAAICVSSSFASVSVESISKRRLLYINCGSRRPCVIVLRCSEFRSSPLLFVSCGVLYKYGILRAWERVGLKLLDLHAKKVLREWVTWMPLTLWSTESPVNLSKKKKNVNFQNAIARLYLWSGVTSAHARLLFLVSGESSRSLTPLPTGEEKKWRLHFQEGPAHR